MMTRAEFLKNKAMIESPDMWPLFTRLPVKKEKHEFKTSNLGYISRDNLTTVYVGNVFMGTYVDVIYYESVDDLLKDGWVVD